VVGVTGWGGATSGVKVESLLAGLLTWAAYGFGLLLLAGVVWLGLTAGIKILDRLLKGRLDEDMEWLRRDREDRNE
jgi:hypothetical protein